jgi:arylsulfatase A-like enzyme/Flp pilus assembly protein TadD
MAARRDTPRASFGPSPRAARPWWQRAAVFAWAALVVAALVAVVFIWPGRSHASLRPIAGQDILLITIDTLRADALGSYGGPAATPALDALAAGGVRFTFAHAHAVMTLTSHASILTGQYPFQHGVRDNSGYRLRRDAQTAATRFKQAGYATAAFVGAFPLHARFGLNAGFDVYDDRFGDGLAPSEFAMPERPATAVVALARQWIAGRTSVAAGASGRPEPWFVWVHVFDPHAPYKPPAPFDSQYAERPYFGEVAAVDAALAPLLDDVRRSGRPTLVIVTGDHGEGLGDHGEAAHGIFAYESTLRVPLIIAELDGGAAPKAGTAGEVSEVAARHVDLLPTMLDAAGRPVPPDLPGRSLLPLGERRSGAQPRTTYFEAMAGMLNHGWAPLTGVLVDREKLIDLPVAERYDLAADAGERSNLFGRTPERDRMLAAALAGFSPVLPGERVAEDAEAAAQLRALGYVSGSAPAKSSYTEADDPKRLIEIDAALHRALDAAGAGRPADAAQIYQQVIDRRPDMAIAYRHLALLAWQQGDGARAIGVLRQAVARGVTDARLLAQLGEYLTDAGHVAEGIRILEPVAKNPAADADALNALGIAYARAGRRDEAKRVFERLLTVLPGSSAPLENLGVLALEQGDAAGAAGYFDRAIAASPDSSRAHAGAAAAAMQRGDRRAACDAWARAVRLDPSNVDALFSLAVTLARDGRMSEARPYLDQFLQSAPPDRYADQRRAVSQLIAGGR